MKRYTGFCQFAALIAIFLIKAESDDSAFFRYQYAVKA
jgi:hypothetical protein